MWEPKMLSEFGDKSKWLDLSVLLKISWVKEEARISSSWRLFCAIARESPAEKEEVEVTEAKLLSCAFGLEESLGGKTKILST